MQDLEKLKAADFSSRDSGGTTIVIVGFQQIQGKVMLRLQTRLWMCLQKASDRFCAQHNIQIGCLKTVVETGALASHTCSSGPLTFLFHTISGVVMSPAAHADAKRLCGSKRFTLDVGSFSAFGLPTLSKDIDEVVQKAPADIEWMKHALVKFLVGTGTVPRTTIGPCSGITLDLWRWHACVRDPHDDVHAVSCLRIGEVIRYLSSGPVPSLHQKFC